MAKVGELDTIVENLVGRGLVAPKFVGRQVGQAMIENLKSLPQALAESQATTETSRINRLSDFKGGVIKGLSGSRRSIQPSTTGGDGPAIDPTQAFVTSRIGGTGFFSGGLNIATPTSEGLRLTNLTPDDPLAKFALQNTRKPAPEANLVTMGGTAKSLMDIRNQLLGNTTDPNAVSGFFQ